MKELNYCTAYLFTINDSYYAFDSETFVTWRVDQDTYSALQYAKQNKQFPGSINSQILFSIMTKARSGCFFIEHEPEMPKRALTYDTLIVSFPIVHACNLHCRYCYARAGEVYTGSNRVLNIETINAIVQYIIKRFQPIKKIRLEFVSGGEPLLDPDRFFALVTHFKKELTDRGYTVEIFLLTNATRLDQAMLKRIKELGAALGISLDGPREVQNDQRPFQNGEGSYDRILESISYMQQFPEFYNNFWVVSVITAGTPDLQSILQQNKELGAKTMEMRVMRGCEPEALALNDKNLPRFKNLYARFAGYLKEHPEDIVSILNEYDTFGKLIKRLILRKGTPSRCTAGVSKLSFTADGEVYPCDSFVGHKEFVMGNVFEQSLHEALYKEFGELNLVSGRRIEPCSDCAIRYMCSSDCHYNAYVVNGSLWNKAGVFCELQTYLLQLAVDLLECTKAGHKTVYKHMLRVAKMQELLNK